MTYDSKGIVALFNQLSIKNFLLKKLFSYLEQSQEPVIILTIQPGGCQVPSYTDWLAQNTGIVGYQLHRLVTVVSIQAKQDTSYTSCSAQYSGIVGNQLHKLVSSVNSYSGIPAIQAGHLIQVQQDTSYTQACQHSIQVQWDTSYIGWLAQFKGIVEYQLHRLVSSVYRYSGIPATQAGQLSIQVQLVTSYTDWLAQYKGIVEYQLHRLVSIQVQQDTSYTGWLAQYTGIVG